MKKDEKNEIEKAVLLEAVKRLVKFSDLLFEQHRKFETFKRNTPKLHESNGVIRASNVIGDMYNERVKPKTKKKKP